MKIKKLIFLPILLFLLSIIVLYQNKQTEGSIIKKDIDLKGGILITVETAKKINVRDVEKTLSENYGSVIISGLRTSTGHGATIEVGSDVNVTNVLNTLESSGVEIKSYSVEIIGPSLGSMFFNQVRTVLVVGFILMAIMMFFIYKNPVPSFGIILAVGGDILAALALTSLFGVSIGFAGFVSLLMFIAYAVDTNIVLTSSVIDVKKKKFEKEYKKALKTGLTITVAIMLTMAVVLFLSTSKLLTNIASVLLAGFFADIIFTWIMNASILEIYNERR